MDLFLAQSTIDITPLKPIPLCGWEDRTSSFERIGSKLEINALVLTQGKKSQVYITVDLLFITDEVKTFAINSLLDVGLEVVSSDVFMVASHTHFAPNIDNEKSILGRVDEDYKSYFLDQLCLLIKQLSQEKPQLCIIRKGVVEVDANINRRRKVNRYYRYYTFIDRKIENGPNYQGVRNQKLSIFEFIVADKTKAILWNYACHPTNYFDRLAVSSDFVGDVRNTIREDSNIPILFFQGFAGNIRANTTPKGSFREELMRSPKSFIVLNKLKYNQFVQVIVAGFKQALSQSDEIKEIKLNSLNYNLELQTIMETSFDRRLQFQLMGFNNKDLFIGISAEPVTEYYNLITSEIKSNDWIPVGYMNTVIGYLPTDKMIKEGGYEVKGFFKLFGFSGAFRNKIERIIVESIKQLING